MKQDSVYSCPRLSPPVEPPLAGPVAIRRHVTEGLVLAPPDPLILRWLGGWGKSEARGQAPGERRYMEETPPWQRNSEAAGRVGRRPCPAPTLVAVW